MIDSIDDLFNSIGVNGTYTFTFRAKDVITDNGRDVFDIARELLLMELYGHDWVQLKLRVDESFINEILVFAIPDSSGNWTVAVNGVKLFLLPGEAPLQELEEFRIFLEKIKLFIQDEPSKSSWITVRKSNSSCGDVIALIQCFRRILYEEPVRDHAAEITLKRFVESSPLTQGFLVQVASALEEEGAFSCMEISEDSLYPYGAGPWAQWYRKWLKRNSPQF